VIVVRGGRQVFVGPHRQGERVAVVTERFGGGEVTVVANAFEDKWITLELTLIAAGVTLLVIVAALIAGGILVRRIRKPLDRAVSAAERIASGDLRARIGSDGPEEFARLGRAFDGMAERLDAVDRDQRRFLGDITHEIATPLNSISGFAQALLDGSAQTPAEVRDSAAMIASGSARLDSLLSDMRRLGSLDAPHSVHREEIDLRRLCGELSTQLLPVAHSAGVELDVRAEDLRVVSDRRLLETIVLNLLTNAVRHTPPGGIVETDVRQRDGHVVVSVRDTGVGIPLEHRERIFDRFYRVDPARVRETGGSGLGLAIAQRAAHALGGQIELDSEPGVGSEFRLVLPVAASETTSP